MRKLLLLILGLLAIAFVRRSHAALEAPHYAASAYQVFAAEFPVAIQRVLYFDGGLATAASNCSSIRKEQSRASSFLMSSRHLRSKGD